jgi:hypothetical protein
VKRFLTVHVCFATKLSGLRNQVNILARNWRCNWADHDQRISVNKQKQTIYRKASRQRKATQAGIPINAAWYVAAIKQSAHGKRK